MDAYFKIPSAEKPDDDDDDDDNGDENGHIDDDGVDDGRECPDLILCPLFFFCRSHTSSTMKGAGVPLLAVNICFYSDTICN